MNTPVSGTGRAAALCRTLVVVLLLVRSFAAWGAQSASSKDALLRLTRLPQISFSVGVAFSGAGRLAWQHDKPDPDEIAALRARLRAEPGDAARWSNLGQLLGDAGDSAAARAACSNAASLYRKRVAQRPESGPELARFGEALWGAGERSEAEAVLRQAVRATPSEPDCWVALGRFLSGTSFAELLPETNQDERLPPTRGLEVLFSTSKPTPAQLEQAERRGAEAIACFDRASSLAPSDAVVLERRAGCRANAALLRVIRENASAPKPDLLAIPLVAMSPDCVPDLRRAAELAPDDARLLGTVALFEVLSAIYQRRSDGPPQLPNPEKLWESVPADTARSVRAKLDRLGELAQSPSTSRAAEAAEALGVLQMIIMGDPRGAETNLRRAVALNPKRDHAWDALALALAMQARPDALLSVCEARLKARPASRNHFFVAKAYEKLDRWDKALEQARAAVRLDPDDFLARSALAVALLHQGSDSALNESAVHLNRAVKLVGQADDAQKNHLKFTAGAALALGGKAGEARAIFRTLVADDKDNQDARAALAIVEKW